MFYSQIILAKKGPLGQLWLAAHFQDRKLSRPQIFATDITASVDSIVHPQVPLALRVSGHLLLGVVRIYSKKVHYLWQDCHQAMVQIQMAFMQQQKQQLQQDNTAAAIDMDPAARGGGDGDRNISFSGRRRKTRSLGDEDEYDADQDVAAALVVPTAATQGFGIPFDLNDDSLENAQDWVPAELDEQNDKDDEETTTTTLGLPSVMATAGSPERRNMARAAADMTLDGSFTMEGSRLSTQSHVEEEWTAFDPDDVEELPKGGEDEKPAAKEMPQQQDGPPHSEEEDGPPLPHDEEDTPMPPPLDEEEDGPPLPHDEEEASKIEDSSILPAAEVPRANESFASEPDVGRPSAINQAPTGKGVPRMSENDLSISQEASGMAQLDDEDDGPAAAARSSSFALDQSSAASLPAPDEGSTAAVSLGDTSAGDKKRKSSIRPKRQRKKRRKIRANEGDIELSNSEIRAMLNDTSDIVQRFPLVCQEADEDGKVAEDEIYGLVNLGQAHQLMNYLSYEQLFARPAFADDGECSPELLDLWKRIANLRDFAPEMADDGTETAGQQPPEEDEVVSEAGSQQARAEDDGAVELGRQQAQEEDEPLPPLPEEDEEEFPQEAQPETNKEAPHPEEEDEPPIFPVDEDMAPPPLPEEEELIETREEEEEKADDPDGRKSSLSLGLVNAIGDDEWANVGDQGEDARQEAGDELVSSNSKWHKHTIKIYSLLKSRLGGAEAGKEPHLSYNALTDGCSRRTAVGVYFELLQLKTWDYIELNQDEPYGDITVSPGPKFSEEAPH